MKEIGEALREQRENIGISIEEVANDLKLRPSQIESIEAGDKDAFKDIFYLKYFIRDYAKYLGMNYEDMIDDFNEFLFDYTSKISLDDIKRAKKQVTIKQEKANSRIASPYTIERRRKINIPPMVLYVLIAIIVLGIGYYIISFFHNDDFVKNEPTENIIK